MRRFLFGVVAGLTLATAFAQAPAPAPPVTLRVAAAADLQPILAPVLESFRVQTTRHTSVSYGSSAQLAQQIESGAPFDVFLSANMDYPQQLADKGLVSTPVAYARGTLVLWARKDSPVQTLSVSGLDAMLAGDKLQKLAIANPAHAPYGMAAQAFLANEKLTDKVQSKLVVAENIAQAAQFAESGNAQAGFISLTSAMTAKFRSEGTYVPVPQDRYPKILQGASVVTNSAHKADAELLVKFLTSPQGQALLRVSGLGDPAN